MSTAQDILPGKERILDWITEGRQTSDGLKLFDDVGQIYEAELARMEFAPYKNDLSLFRRRTAYFEEVQNEKTFHYYISQVPGKGQIGHTSQYSVHWFYPYKGKYHGQMIRALINFMAPTDKDVILDPFVGSGTTLVEASMIGIPSVGIDINPACCFVSRIKVDCLSLRAEAVEKVLATYDVETIFHFFDRALFKAQYVVKDEDLDTDIRILLNRTLSQVLETCQVQLEPEVRNFLLMCYIHSLSDYTYLKKTRKAQSKLEFFKRDLAEYVQTIRGTNHVQDTLGLSWGRADVRLGSALSLPFDPNSVKGIVTSPPYSIAIDYIKNDEHLLNYLAINPYELRSQMVGLKGKGEQKLEMYSVDIKQSLQEMLRVLVPSGYAAIVLGDVTLNGQRTEFYKLIQKWAPEIGFRSSYLIRRPILGGYARLRYEYIILLQK